MKNNGHAVTQPNGNSLARLEDEADKQGDRLPPEPVALQEAYAQLLTETENRARQLAMLNKASQALTSTLDLDAVLEQMIVEANALLQAGGASVLLPDADGDHLKFVAVAVPAARALVGTRIPLKGSIAGWVMQHKQPALVQHAQNDPRFYAAIDRLTGDKTDSLLAMPLLVNDQAIGVVEIINKVGHPFHQTDVELLTMLVGSAAIAIENARLYDEVERHAQQLQVLHELDRAITTSLRIADVYHAFSAHAARLLTYDYMSVCLIRGEEAAVAYLVDRTENRFPEGLTFPLQNSMMSWVVARSQPLIRHDIAAGQRFVEDAPLLERDIRSVLAVPLRSKSRIVGMWCLGCQQVGAYDPPDLEIGQAMADLLAIAIENATLFELVQSGREQMRWLAQQAVSAHETERHRLSYELHDEAGQNLVALKMLLGFIQDEIPAEATKLHAHFAEALRMTDTTMERLRTLARDLRPPALNVAGGLNDTFEEFCREFGQRTQLAIAYEGVDLDSVPEPVITCLYRFLQESLTNVAKHARAERVQVKLEVQPKRVSLRVRDDGLGFNREVGSAIARQQKGIGLLGMQERLELLGGWLEIESQPGQGSCLIAHLPLEEK